MRGSTIDTLQKREAVMDGLKSMMNTEGWVVVRNIVKEEVDMLDSKIKASNNQEEVYSCTKRKFGILFVVEEVERLLKEGNSAVNILRGLHT